MGASDGDLERSVESCEHWEWLGGGLVVVGLIAAVGIAALHPPYDSFWDQWGSVVADSLVALGVVAEIKFGQMAGLRQSEVKRRSDEKIAELNVVAERERHARAKIEQQLAPRELTKEQCDKLQALANRLERVGIASAADFESVIFAGQITKALYDAGIEVLQYPPRGGLVWAGLHIVIPEPVDDFGQEPISSAFREAGLHTGCSARGAFALQDIPADLSVIMVGSKPPPHRDSPPYVMTVPPKTDAHERIIDPTQTTEA